MACRCRCSGSCYFNSAASSVESSCREFASRLREAPGISDHEVRDWLGHANITTTSRYLATTRTTLQQAPKKFEQHRAVAQALHKRVNP
jgi:hypothetical protein